MQVLGRTVRPPLAATAQTLYGTLGLGIATTLATLAAGPLYGALGAGAFWVMAGPARGAAAAPGSGTRRIGCRRTGRTSMAAPL